MKTFYSIVIFCLLSALAVAQVPQFMNYQAVARDAAGNVLANHFINVRFILYQELGGPPEYIETDTVTTNRFGLFSVELGHGQANPGDTFANLYWAFQDKALAVYLDPDGGTNFSFMGLSPMAAVPYAFYAQSYGPSFHYGEAYQGGFIFYISADGKHGLIVDSTDLSATAQWSNTAANITGASRNGVNGGLYNTQLIISSQDTGSYAAMLCAKYTGGGYADWYLPSMAELNLLLQVDWQIGGFGTGVYWSSDENGPQNALGLNFSTAQQASNGKTTTAAVRAVRIF